MSKMVPGYREDAKRRIVEAGLEVMYEKGYCKTTMDDIAALLNVSKPALYRYFKGKDELVIESSKIIHEKYKQVSEHSGAEGCPVETWINIFDQMMSPDLNEHALLLELFGLSVREPAIRDFSTTRMKNGIDSPALSIAEQQAEMKILSGTDPRTLAIAIVSMFNGMRIMMLLGTEREELRFRWAEIIRALFGLSGDNKESDKCHSDCPVYEVCNRVR